MEGSNTFIKFSDVNIGDSFMYGLNVYIRIPSCYVTALDEGIDMTANVINLRTGKFGKFCGGTNVIHLKHIKCVSIL